MNKQLYKPLASTIPYSTLLYFFHLKQDNLSAHLDTKAFSPLQMSQGDMPESEETVANMLQSILDSQGSAVSKVEAIGIAIGVVSSFFVEVHHYV